MHLYDVIFAATLGLLALAYWRLAAVRPVRLYCRKQQRRGLVPRARYRP